MEPQAKAGIISHRDLETELLEQIFSPFNVFNLSNS